MTFEYQHRRRYACSWCLENRPRSPRSAGTATKPEKLGADRALPRRSPAQQRSNATGSRNYAQANEITNNSRAGNEVTRDYARVRPSDSMLGQFYAEACSPIMATPSSALQKGFAPHVRWSPGIHCNLERSRCALQPALKKSSEVTGSVYSPDRARMRPTSGLHLHQNALH